MRLSTSARVTLVSNAVAMGAIAVAWSLNWPSEPLLSYGVHKFLHIAGVVVFFGNLMVGPLWILYAWFLEEGRHYAFAAKTLSDADLYFTVPGIQLTVWNGLFLSSAMGGIGAVPWLVESMVLLVITTVLSVAVVLPAQERVVELAAGDDRDASRRALVVWSILGTSVMIPISLVAWLMVVKQPLFL